MSLEGRIAIKGSFHFLRDHLFVVGIVIIGFFLVLDLDSHLGNFRLVVESPGVSTYHHIAFHVSAHESGLHLCLSVVCSQKANCLPIAAFGTLDVN
jgi:hypothetical protein